MTKDNDMIMDNCDEPLGEYCKVNFGLTGLLNAKVGDKKNDQEENELIKQTYSQPLDAVKPDSNEGKWQMYIFNKKGKVKQIVSLHDKSYYTLGKDADTCDILDEHKSISANHAVLQYRLKQIMPELGSLKPPTNEVRLYIIDLESAKGTKMNNKKIDSAKYIQILPEDKITLGKSKNEYIFLKS